MKKFTLLIALMAFVGLGAFGQETVSSTPSMDGSRNINICADADNGVIISIENSMIGEAYRLLRTSPPAAAIGPITGNDAIVSFSTQYFTSENDDQTYSIVNSVFTPIAPPFSVVVVADPIAPSLSREPDNTVCAGTVVKTTGAGSGGVAGCQDYYQYSTDGGDTWAHYTSGTNISTTGLSGTNVVQVKAWRAHPDGLGCKSGEDLVMWTVNPQPVGPTGLLKTPDQEKVCEGTDVYATFTSGTGGVGCIDEFQYSYDGSTYVPYTAGTAISTTGKAENAITIQGQRTGCTAGAGCNGTAWTTLATWEVYTVTSAVFDKTDASCGNNNGVITISSPQGGTTNYEYTIDGGTSWQESGLFENLAPDTYVVQIRDTETFCVTTLDDAYAIVDLAAVALAAVNDAGDKTAMQTALEDEDLCIDDYDNYDDLVPARQTAVAKDMLDNRPATGFANIADVKTLFDKLVTLRLTNQVAVDAANDGSFTIQDLKDVNTALNELVDNIVNGTVITTTHITEGQAAIDALETLVPGRFAALVNDLQDNSPYASFTEMGEMLEP